MSQAIVTEGKLVAIGDAIRQQLGTSTPYTLDEMATAIASISGGGGGGGDDNKLEVMVFDYDGTILDQVKLETGDTYTLPTPPVHAGLTFVDWSCTETITSNTITIAENDVMIGANYTTTSGLSEFDIEVKGTSLTIRGYAYNGYTFNWGDGTSNTATSNGFIVHTYASAGKYTVTYNGTQIYGYGSSSAWYQFYGFLTSYNNNSASIISCEAIRISNSVTSYGGYPFATIKNCRYIILSKNASVPQYLFPQNVCTLQCIIVPNGVTQVETGAFSYCFGLKYVVFPMTISNIFGNVVESCRALEKVIMPVKTSAINCYAGSNFRYTGVEKIYLNKVSFNSGSVFDHCDNLKKVTLKRITSLQNSFFSYCPFLEDVTLENTTSLSSNCFEACVGLKKIKLPSTLTYIGSQAFANCCSLIEYDFTALTSVPTLYNANAFQYHNENFKIYVPDSLYTTWIAASNWSTYASYIYKASDRS